jgi:hypothetical protein
MWPVSGDYEAALTESTQTVRFRAQLHNATFEPLATPLVIAGGSVNYELGNPAGHATVELADREGNLPSADNPVWFARNVEIQVDLKVNGQWESVPLFFGPVQDVSRQGLLVTLECDSKEVQHLEPHTAARPISIRKHTKLHRAIRDILEDRGETRFDLAHVRQRIPKNRNLDVGVEPWKVCRSLARDADMQLYYRGNGRLHLRDWPTTAAWRFRDGQNATLVAYPEERLSIGPIRDTVVVIGERTEKVIVSRSTELDQPSAAGSSSVHIKNDDAFIDLLEPGKKITMGEANPETRKVAGSYTPGSRTIPLSAPLDRVKRKGAPITVSGKEDRERPVVGRASLTQNHRLSAQSLTDGKRPRVEIDERPSIHKKKRAEEIAAQRRDRISGHYEQAITVSSVPIWHLELGDIFVVNFRGVEHRSRIQRLSFPLTLGESMEINWAGNRPPPRRKNRR